MRRVRNGVVEEDTAANNSGDFSYVKIPEPALKWKDEEEVLRRYIIGDDGKPKLVSGAELKKRVKDSSKK